ncbi:MAG: hypothetical protein ACQKBW_12755 [Puniceicoccales bacterium]
MCEDWAQTRSSQIAASTFNNERDTLIAIFEYARREGIVLDNPSEVLPRRKQPKPGILIPSREQYEGLSPGRTQGRKSACPASQCSPGETLCGYSGAT